ncbi:hypothetical protein GW17_00028753 [Ensete ventricosum]|nr:hypothetical protein GW17_00028753 [Ensete ventricosum]
MTISVLVRGSSPSVARRVVVPRGEMESPVNLVNEDVNGIKFWSIRPSFWKASKYKMSAKLPVSIIIRLTRTLAMRMVITRVSPVWDANSVTAAYDTTVTIGVDRIASSAARFGKRMERRSCDMSPPSSTKCWGRSTTWGDESTRGGCPYAQARLRGLAT